MRRAWSRPMAPVPITPILTVLFRPLCPVCVDVALHFGAHEAPRGIGLVFPGEDAGGHDPVKADLGEGAEEVVPGHLALADVQVLVDARLRAGRVKDVAQAAR